MVKRYLVLKLARKFEVTGFPFAIPAQVDFATDKELLGVCYVFKNRKDALRYAKNPELIQEIREIPKGE